MGDDVEVLEDVLCDRETLKAIHVLTSTGDAYWIPKSVVHEDSEVWKANQEGKLVIKQWFAEKEGIC